MDENFSMEWNMEWKIFGREWKWTGRKLPAWNMEKSSSIPFHTMPCLQRTLFRNLSSLVKHLKEMQRYIYVK